MKIKLLFLPMLLMIFNQVSADPASGNFVAAKACDLYQSKSKKSNPGNHITKTGNNYPVIEILKNAADNISWVRIRTAHQQSPERWIKADCGKIQNLVQHTGLHSKHTSKSECSIANHFDSHILAISWQPAFCELKGHNKAECTSLSAQRFDAKHFTLHGLWPNKKSCGKKYGNCGAIKKKPASFCDYPALSLNDDVRNRLAAVMPSSAHGTCLQRHEWWKHGTCSGLNENQYYSLSILLLEQINQSNFVKDYIANQTGNILTRAKFKSKFEKSFGQGSFEKVATQCKNGLLTELQIALPVNITKDSNLKSLLSTQGVPTNGKGNCSSHFKLDEAL